LADGASLLISAHPSVRHLLAAHRIDRAIARSSTAIVRGISPFGHIRSLQLRSITAKYNSANSTWGDTCTISTINTDIQHTPPPHPPSGSTRARCIVGIARPAGAPSAWAACGGVRECGGSAGMLVCGTGCVGGRCVSLREGEGGVREGGCMETFAVPELIRYTLQTCRSGSGPSVLIDDIIPWRSVRLQQALRRAGPATSPRVSYAFPRVIRRLAF
jgi:hypothetical protein